MRKLALKLLPKKLDKVVESWESQNDVKPEDYKKLSQGHFRSKSLFGINEDQT